MHVLNDFKNFKFKMFGVLWFGVVSYDMDSWWIVHDLFGLCYI